MAGESQKKKKVYRCSLEYDTVDTSNSPFRKNWMTDAITEHFGTSVAKLRSGERKLHFHIPELHLACDCIWHNENHG